MRRVACLARSTAFAAALIALAMIAAALATANRGNPELFPANGEGVEVVLVSHGWHSGLALPRVAVARVAGERGYTALIGVAQRFGAYPWIEIGWGEDRFYRSTPTADDVDWGLALRALFAPGNSSVLHVVGLSAPARDSFPAARLVAVTVSPTGFERLLAEIDMTFAASAEKPPTSLGPGLYGPSLFYEARGTFDLFNVCNHWTARMLSAAGVPTAPLPAVLPAGLIWDLRWRSDLTELAPPDR